MEGVFKDVIASWQKFLSLLKVRLFFFKSLPLFLNSRCFLQMPNWRGMNPAVSQCLMFASCEHVSSRREPLKPIRSGKNAARRPRSNWHRIEPRLSASRRPSWDMGMTIKQNVFLSLVVRSVVQQNASVLCNHKLQC